jgi:hypothetical protein
MANEMFIELEKAINEELAKRVKNMTIKVKGFEKGGFLTDLSRTRVTAEEYGEICQSLSIAWEKIKTKWFKEYFIER